MSRQTSQRNSQSDDNGEVCGKKTMREMPSIVSHSSHTDDPLHEIQLKMFMQFLVAELSSISQLNRQIIRVKLGKYLFSKIDEILANKDTECDNCGTSNSNESGNNSAPRNINVLADGGNDEELIRIFAKTILGEIRNIACKKKRESIRLSGMRYLMTLKTKLIKSPKKVPVHTMVNAWLLACQNSETDIDKP